MSHLDLHSPKQVAQVLGVSESSLKRWCDQGLLQTTRTVGGHRKLPTAEVIRFARERGLSLVAPELLGLPPSGSTRDLDLTQAALMLAESLLSGNEALSRQIVLNLALGEIELARVFDDVITRAFVEIGDRWACEQIDVYQERRGCEMILRILSELRKSQAMSTHTLTACGGTVEGNNYSLQTLMAEIVLRDNGYQATSLGTGIPFESLMRAIRETRPNLFWLSAAYIADESEFVQGFNKLSAVCAETQSALVIGGRALTPSIQEQLVDFTYCDNMQQFAGFARNFSRVHQRILSSGSISVK